MQSRDLKDALSKLVDAGLIRLVRMTKATGIPLNSALSERAIKVVFLDCGLVMATSLIDPKILMQDNLVLLN